MKKWYYYATIQHEENNMIKISPSILSADFSRLGEEIEKLDDACCDMAHIDVMDGHFVPNLTFGAPVIKWVRDRSGIVFDVHLMIDDPLKYIEDFRAAGADIITFHYESKNDPQEVIDAIKKSGAKVGMSIKPATGADVIFPYLDQLDMVLIMSVEPGFGGQGFMENSLPKLEAVKNEIIKKGLDIDLQVDGGINNETVVRVVKAGANVIVAGSSLFGAPDFKKAVEEMRGAALLAKG